MNNTKADASNFIAVMHTVEALRVD